ncbi:MAG: mechanosensitive ion channel [Planctomycetes bacterium]|nr:mechanosensitive ion channel [Planctomycetota bacterium]
MSIEAEEAQVILSETIPVEAGAPSLGIVDHFASIDWQNLLMRNALIFIGCLVGYLIAKNYILRVIRHFIKKTPFKWDDFLVKHKVFQIALQAIPFLVFYYFAKDISLNWAPAQKWIEKFMLSAIVIISMQTIAALMNAFTDVYRQLNQSMRRPIKGYVQMITIFMYFLGSLLIIAIILEKDLTAIFAGLGALTAVILLVFKDTILGLVASIQITSNHLIKIGDWIEIDKYGADGDVIDISLHTIKVQNWDKTITSIPTYALISDSFKNWRGMSESGGRRIKRSLSIDVSSIHFCSEALLEKLCKVDLLEDYLQQVNQEIDEYNTKDVKNTGNLINGRHLTNIGIFRKYVEAYLHKHPKVHKSMTFLVRHLEPGPNGLPIQIYVFSSDQVWSHYESIQADIFDHILAAVPEFELRVFQNPNGYDFQSWKSPLTT